MSVPGIGKSGPIGKTMIAFDGILQGGQGNTGRMVGVV
jgi:hypothetical protein